MTPATEHISDTLPTPAPASHVIVLRATFFRDLSGHTCKERVLLWPKLIERVRNPRTYPTKEAMPLVKLATFGESRSGGRSLRNDANIIEIDGIEGDYDAGEITLADAATLLFDADVKALLYSSPSSTPERPRWRVLAPLSKPCAPAERRLYAGRLNAVLQGALAPESFALSQAFYIGRAATAAHYEAQEVRGERCIDELDELEPVYPSNGNGEAPSAATEAIGNDPVLRALRERAMLHRQVKPGTWAIVCPWESAHTGEGGATATVYLQAAFDGRQSAGFVCKHGHCSERSLGDLFAFLGLRGPSHRAVVNARRREVSEAHPDAQNAPAGELASVVLRRVADVEAVPIRWLWPGRIARGKITIIAGHPGLGKSQVTCALAAVVTTGGRWPLDGTHCELGNVAMLSAEDDIADTIRPRLEAVGADVARVEALDGVIDAFDAAGNPVLRALNLRTDIAALDAMLSDRPALALLVIDPVTAYLGATDSHVTADVRALLAPLSALAAKRAIAIVLVSHLNKGGANTDALMRVTGSLAFVAAARGAFIVAKDNDNPARRLFLPAKNNIGKDIGGLAFVVESVTLPKGIETSRVLWEREPVTITADEAMRPPEDDNRSELEDAAAFLRGLLADGPVSSRQIKTDAEGAGHAWATIRRAQQRLGIEARKLGLNAGWVWELPPKVLKSTEDAHEKNVSAFETNEHLRDGSDYQATRDGEPEIERGEIF